MTISFYFRYIFDLRGPGMDRCVVVGVFDIRLCKLCLQHPPVVFPAQNDTRADDQPAHIHVFQRLHPLLRGKVQSRENETYVTAQSLRNTRTDHKR